MAQQAPARTNGRNGNSAHARDALTDRAKVLLEIAKDHGLLSYNGNQAEYRQRIDDAASDPRAGANFRAEIAALKLHDGIGTQEPQWAVRELVKRLHAAQVPA